MTAPDATPALRRARTSAGLLMFRRRPGGFKFLLVHPGGTFFTRKDEGVWTIPKGEVAPDEDLLTRARIEFEEELGLAPVGDFLSLGEIRQKAGKTVHAGAFESDVPNDFVLRSNTFELEWPPRSGRRQSFPEIDRAEFFADEIARQKSITFPSMTFWLQVKEIEQVRGLLQFPSPKELRANQISKCVVISDDSFLSRSLGIT